MVLHTIKNVLPMKVILKALLCSSIDKHIKILQIQLSRKTVVKELGKME